MSPSSEDLYTTLKTTATSHIHAFSSTSGPTGSPFDPENVYAYRTPTCIMRFHPGSSMPPPFNGPITRLEHEPALLMIGAVTEKVQMEIHEMTVDVKMRTVAARLTAHYTFKPVRENPEYLEWPIEYVWIVECDERGERIVRMEECLGAERAGVMLRRAEVYAEDQREAGEE